MAGEYVARRRFPRIPSENAVLVKKLDAERIEGFAKTRVVGLGGCMFVSDEPLGIGTHLEILISVHGNVAKAIGHVVYEVSRRSKEIEIGMEFVDLSEPDRAVIESLFPSAPVGSAEAAV